MNDFAIESVLPEALAKDAPTPCDEKSYISGFERV